MSAAISSILNISKTRLEYCTIRVWPRNEIRTVWNSKKKFRLTWKLKDCCHKRSEGGCPASEAVTAYMQLTALVFHVKKVTKVLSLVNGAIKNQLFPLIHTWKIAVIHKPVEGWKKLPMGSQSYTATLFPYVLRLNYFTTALCGEVNEERGPSDKPWESGQLAAIISPELLTAREQKFPHAPLVSQFEGSLRYIHSFLKLSFLSILLLCFPCYDPPT